MNSFPEKLQQDIERVQQIAIVPSLLEVVCRTTGMGFAAIARVTDDKWVACSVRDEISFGLQVGGELSLETTICNEIRQHHQPVVIDHVSEHPYFAQHHTPAMYGFQSYISVPIVLKSGEFFGTLCAIDPRPADLDNVRVRGMFTLFAELIAFHLQSIEQLEQGQSELLKVNIQLDHSQYENQQYRFISHHNLQEPLRKIGIFSGLLLSAADNQELAQVRQYAVKIDDNARRIALMIRDLSDFSYPDDISDLKTTTDLNEVIMQVRALCQPDLELRQATLFTDRLPVVQAVTGQMEQLFYNLVQHALHSTQKGVAPVIRISSEKLTTHEGQKGNFCLLRITDNGTGMAASQLARVFDFFSLPLSEKTNDDFSSGMAYCRKIVRNHGGSIQASSISGSGMEFTVVLPC